MACPTCDHTMELVNDESLKIWHCQRCGTLKMLHFAEGSLESVYVPKLVERCRAFAREMGPEWLAQCGHLVTAWRTLGIAESIAPPEKRTEGR